SRIRCHAGRSARRVHARAIALRRPHPAASGPTAPSSDRWAAGRRIHSEPARRGGDRPHSCLGRVAGSLHLETEVLELTTRHPFLIARGGQALHHTVWVRVRDADGCVGWGEAAPTMYYGETPETVLAALNMYAPHLPPEPFDLEMAERTLTNVLGENPS